MNDFTLKEKQEIARIRAMDLKPEGNWSALLSYIAMAVGLGGSIIGFIHPNNSVQLMPISMLIILGASSNIEKRNLCKIIQKLAANSQISEEIRENGSKQFQRSKAICMAILALIMVYGVYSLLM